MWDYFFVLIRFWAKFALAFASDNKWMKRTHFIYGQFCDTREAAISSPDLDFVTQYWGCWPSSWDLLHCFKTKDISFSAYPVIYQVCLCLFDAWRSSRRLIVLKCGREIITWYLHRNLTLNTFYLYKFFSYYDFAPPRKIYGVVVNNNVVVDT